MRTDDLRYTRYFVTIQFLESLFIWCCCELPSTFTPGITHQIIIQVLHACRNSRGAPAVRGRVSVQLSMADLPIDIQNHSTDNHDQRVGRGWWDYVPTSEKGPTAISNEELCERDTALGTLKAKASRSFRQCHCGFKTLCRKFSKKVHLPSSDFGTPPFVRIDDNAGDGRTEIVGDSRRSPPTASSGNRLSRLIPRMELFRKVMTDEVTFLNILHFQVSH